jgi:hypothetical protein
LKEKIQLHDAQISPHREESRSNEDFVRLLEAIGCTSVEGAVKKVDEMTEQLTKSDHLIQNMSI